MSTERRSWFVSPLALACFRGGSSAAREVFFLAMLTALGCGNREVQLDGNVRDAGNPNSYPDAIAPGVSIAVMDQESAVEIAVDDERLYWRSRLPDAWGDGLPPSRSQIRSCLKSACRGTTVTYDSVGYVAGGSLTVPQFESLAVSRGRAFWTRAVNVDVVLLTCPSAGCTGAPQVLFDEVDAFSTVADDTHLYWASVSNTAIMRFPLDGSGKPEPIALNQNPQYKLAASATHVFWTAIDTRPFVAIRGVAKSGNTPVSDIATESSAVTLAVDAQFLYWAPSDRAGSIVRCPLTGCRGSPELVLPEQSSVVALASDGGSLAWINALDGVNTLNPRGRVARCRIDDCPATVETLAVQAFAANGMSLAMDRTHIYWVAQGPEDSRVYGRYLQATIYRYAK